MMRTTNYNGKEYTRNQMAYINAALRDAYAPGMNVQVLENPGYSADQMALIYAGMRLGHDVSVFANPAFDLDQMMEIFLGQQLGLDVTIYARPEFSSDQMMQVRDGLDRGLNASVYADPKYSAGVMEEIRIGLDRGLDVSTMLDPEMRDVDALAERKYLEAKAGIGGVHGYEYGDEPRRYFLRTSAN